MSEWTGLAFGDAWPYLAAGYGLFFACLALGFASVWWQWRALKRRQRILDTLKQV